MTAETFAEALASGKASLVVGVTLSLLLLALRNLPKVKALLDPLTMKREALALALLVLPAVVPALLSGAPTQDTLLAALTAVGVALGLQSRGKAK